MILELDELFFPGCSPLIDLEEQYKWLMYKDKGIVGYCTMRVLESIGYLSRAAVLASHRGNGLQKKMIKKRVQLAKELNLSAVVTYTTHDNYASWNNLQDCGFKLYKPQNPWAGDMLYWRRLLNH